MLGVAAVTTDAASSPTAASPSDAPMVDTIGARLGAMTSGASSRSSSWRSSALRRTRTNYRITDGMRGMQTGTRETFGRGILIAMENDRAEVDFGGHGVRVVRKEFLQRC